jgi:hypothetical protein
VLDNQLLHCDSLTDYHISVSSVDMFCTFTYSSKFSMKMVVVLVCMFLLSLEDSVPVLSHFWWKVSVNANQSLTHQNEISTWNDVHSLGMGFFKERACPWNITITNGYNFGISATFCTSYKQNYISLIIQFKFQLTVQLLMIKSNVSCKKKLMFNYRLLIRAGKG